MSENHKEYLLGKLQSLEVRIIEERAHRDKLKQAVADAVSANKKMTDIEELQEVLDMANNQIASTQTLIGRLRSKLKRQK